MTASTRANEANTVTDFTALVAANPVDDTAPACHRRAVTTPVTPKRIELVQLPAAALHALAAGDLADANDAAAVPLTPYFAGGAWASVWQRRSRQIVADPDSAEWITGVIWDPEARVAVGRAGYHGPPDAAGMVEVGYAVDPAYRRQGYARAALVALLERAAREPAVRTVRATVSPDNIASSSLIMQYGFVEVGEQWDDEDGREIVYEVPA